MVVVVSLVKVVCADDTGGSYDSSGDDIGSGSIGDGNSGGGSDRVDSSGGGSYGSRLMT